MADLMQDGDAHLVDQFRAGIAHFAQISTKNQHAIGHYRRRERLFLQRYADVKSQQVFGSFIFFQQGCIRRRAHLDHDVIKKALKLLGYGSKRLLHDAVELSGGHLYHSRLGRAALAATKDRSISVRKKLPKWAAVLGIACGCVVMIGCAPMSLLITPVAADRSVKEMVVEREAPLATRRIAIIDVEGMISNSRDSNLITGVEGDNKVGFFKEKLDAAAKDDRVKAVIVRINSPGGGVTASDLMYHELRKFRDCTGKPIIACMLDLAASGGYYIACAADRIIATPTTVTGSIGVIMFTVNLTGTLDKIGAEVITFKSGELKDAGSPFREMNERDRAVFQHLISEMYERFLSVVQRGRPGIAPQRVRELADGRVYLAPDALREGLVDEIGTMDDAVSAAKSAAGIKGPVTIVQYARPYAHRPNYYAEAPTAIPQVNLLNVDVGQLALGTGPQFMYLWAPGR
jgi:protease IV